MPAISDNVGDGGANQKHDVSIVQVMLRVINNAKGRPYLAGNYDGAYGKATKQAIIAFQTDKALIPAAGSGGATGAGVEKLGVVAKAGKTFAQLVKDLPAAYANIQCLQNTNLVYLEHSAGASASSLTELGKAELEATFRTKVVDLATQFYANHKLALSIAGKSGGRRDFQRQLELYQQGRTKPGMIVTWVGPGESNHQWGRAVDIAPNSVQWLRGNTTTVTDDWWFNKLNKADAKKYNNFYPALIKARDALATPLGMFRLKNKKGNLIDPPHLQSYDQSTVSMGRSLVALLNAAGVGVCKWKSAGGSYSSDYGIGGTTHFAVGASHEIFSGNANVTKAKVAQAHNELAKAKAAGKAYAKLAAKDIKATELADVRKRLKADWVKADAEWRRWTPLP